MTHRFNGPLHHLPAQALLAWQHLPDANHASRPWRVTSKHCELSTTLFGRTSRCLWRPSLWLSQPFPCSESLAFLVSPPQPYTPPPTPHPPTNSASPSDTTKPYFVVFLSFFCIFLFYLHCNPLLYQGLTLILLYLIFRLLVDFYIIFLLLLFYWETMSFFCFLG